MITADRDSYRPAPARSSALAPTDPARLVHSALAVRTATREALAELRALTTDEAVIQRWLAPRVRAKLGVAR